MILSVNCGHTKTGPGYGAVSGNYKESEINRLVGKELIRLLKKKGHTVYNSTVDKAVTQNAYLQETVKLADQKPVDYFISLHCNAGGGNGMEVFTYKGRKLDRAIKVCYELSRLGFKNRGIKDGSHLYVVKNTQAKAILIEMFFLDSGIDQFIYKSMGYKEVAKAIAEAF